MHKRKAAPGADVTIWKAKECVTGESSKYLSRKQREEALSSLALVTEQLTRVISSHTSVFTRSGRQTLPTHRKTLGEGGMNIKQSAKLLEVWWGHLARLIVRFVLDLAHIWLDCATWWFDRDDLRRESDPGEKSHLAQGQENEASAALCGYFQVPWPTHGGRAGASHSQTPNFRLLMSSRRSVPRLRTENLMALESHLRPCRSLLAWGELLPTTVTDNKP